LIQEHQAVVNLKRYGLYLFRFIPEPPLTLVPEIRDVVLIQRREFILALGGVGVI
jgi:hypothetical protein